MRHLDRIATYPPMLEVMRSSFQRSFNSSCRWYKSTSKGKVTGYLKLRHPQDASKLTLVTFLLSLHCYCCCYYIHTTLPLLSYFYPSNRPRVRGENFRTHVFRVSHWRGALLRRNHFLQWKRFLWACMIHFKGSVNAYLSDTILTGGNSRLLLISLQK